MNDRRVQIYVVLMIATGAACLWWADWSALTSLPPSSLLGFVGLVAIALFSESVAIGLSVGGGKSSITFLPLLASVQLFGPEGGLALIVPTMAFVEFVVRRKALSKGLFNVSQAVVGTTLAGGAFGLLGGRALELEGAANVAIGSQLLAACETGPIHLVNAVSGERVADPFLPRIEPGTTIPWLLPAPVGTDTFLAARPVRDQL